MSFPAKISTALCIVLLGSTTTGAAEVDFQRDLLPLLQQHCLDCHGPDAAESDLRLDNLTDALRGGDSGEAAIVPGQSDRSYLIARVLHDDPAQRMPPDSERLSDQQIELLKSWIDDATSWQGAEAELAGRRSDHWAFQPLVRPEPPDLHSAAVRLQPRGADDPDAADEHISNPIDAFIIDRLHSEGLSPSHAADRRKLIRRLYLVMHGLPPTPEQTAAFLADRRENAWQRLVDRVLASPRYGERWATHWLDLVRFGETHGFETNRERPHAWRYRDWVIAAFNDDQPYDQFIIEQLAGDAVGADVATGFLVAGPYDLVKGQDTQLRLIQRQDELADMINTTGTAFLGLSLGCARCHNHKFDPVTQTDYYALQAIFAGVEHGDRTIPLDQPTRQRLDNIDAEVADLHQRLTNLIRSHNETSAPTVLRWRQPVDAALNEESFPAIEARFVRFTIAATNQGQPCIDELEIFSGTDSVGLASKGAQATSNGDFEHPLHKLEQIHDGRYGNDRSWISSHVSGGWVQIELPRPRSIDSIRWGRDRHGKFRDRLATDYRIEASLDGEHWTTIASSDDRLPLAAETTPPTYDFTHLPPTQAEQGQAWSARLESLLAERKTLAESAVAYAGTFSQPGPTHRLYRGEPSAPREAVAPATIAALGDLRLADDTPEQQRRLALARWIAAADNPLTARVIVNRIWQHHFGEGLIDTPSDYGGNGTPPSHPELLDWLAVELIESGWSLKHLQRLIVTSGTWRQDSRPHDRGLDIDAATRLLWRFPPRRLAAEGIRDSMLAVTDKLDATVGGPGFSAFEVEAENVRHYFPKTDFGPDDWRRMIYMTKVRQERDAIFGVFDCPDFNQVVPKRNRSTTPLQALNLLNSPFVLQQADFLAARLQRSADSDAARVELAYELCFSRPADDQEIAAAIGFVEQAGWPALARALLNANEFVLIP